MIFGSPKNFRLTAAASELAASPRELASLSESASLGLPRLSGQYLGIFAAVAVDVFITRTVVVPAVVVPAVVAIENWTIDRTIVMPTVIIIAKSSRLGLCNMSVRYEGLTSDT